MIQKMIIKKIAKTTLVGTLALTMTLTSTSIVSADRGHCTDSHSKDWCDANGYENNRPVAGKVRLTGKQFACFMSMVASGLIVVKDCVITKNYADVPATLLSSIACFA